MFGTLLSPKLVRREYPAQDGTVGLILHEHWCPGCNGMHQIAVDTPFRNGARWTWDGNAAAPTFSPSINITVDYSRTGRPPKCCHYFIRSGRIEFCGDSTHLMAGQTADLPDIPTEELE
jgi:hypothetical protein